ncbi:hypothetical protein [Bacillus sp. CGMCC 1.16541]|uniref:hypothetical protein n=1 Tax=Bacillus sp. CGMCC 1.16541 TaxID=2185143 RepID=UPI000D736C38|nr:hypothetical protein [Bacillus sp. CGMCC 1.16541]
MIKVFDKAQWQIDNGISSETVLKHFINMFEWLMEKNYLSSDGKEVLELGLDSSISLNEKMLTTEGIEFLDKYYDKFIEQTQYEVNLELYMLEKYHQEYLNEK